MRWWLVVLVLVGSGAAHASPPVGIVAGGGIGSTGAGTSDGSRITQSLVFDIAARGKTAGIGAHIGATSRIRLVEADSRSMYSERLTYAYRSLQYGISV